MDALMITWLVIVTLYFWVWWVAIIAVAMIMLFSYNLIEDYGKFKKLASFRNSQSKVK
jgi:hypothetical protein